MIYVKRVLPCIGDRRQKKSKGHNETTPQSVTSRMTDERIPAPVDVWFNLLFTIQRVSPPSKVVQDLFYQQYVANLCNIFTSLKLPILAHLETMTWPMFTLSWHHWDLCNPVVTELRDQNHGAVQGCWRISFIRHLKSAPPDTAKEKCVEFWTSVQPGIPKATFASSWKSAPACRYSAHNSSLRRAGRMHVAWAGHHKHWPTKNDKQCATWSCQQAQHA